MPGCACHNYAESVYYTSMASEHGFLFPLDEELSEHNLVAVVVTTPTNRAIQIWTEVELAGRTAILRQFAIYGIDAAPRHIGAVTLRAMARAAMEEFNVDCIRIE